MRQKKVIPREKKLLHNLVRQIRLVIFDFDGVFTDNRVFVLEDGTEGVFCYRGDGFGLKALERLGIELLVISTEVNPVVSARCKKLGLGCIQGCENKLKSLEQEALRLGISLKNVAYLGNDINDQECLEKVGLPACVGDSHPDIFSSARYITKIKGGRGAVREFCDLIVRLKNEKLS